jgi:hypothetical protein
MDLIPLNEVTPTPGVPDRITVNFPVYADSRISVLYLQVLPGNMQDVYVGREGMNVAAKTGIITRLRPPTANYLPDIAWHFSINISNPLLAGRYVIDVDNAGDGVIPSIGLA